MAVSEVSICNSALTKVGNTQYISSLVENNKAAKICNQQYEFIRDMVLAGGLWTFAIKRVSLAQVATSPAFEYTYQYQLPSDFLTDVEVSPDQVDYVIESDKLLTYSDTLSLRYVYRNEDPTHWSPEFVEAFATRLAVELAYPLVQSVTLKKELMEEYKLLIGDARTFNAQKGRPKSLQEDTFLNSRWQGVPYGMEKNNG